MLYVNIEKKLNNFTLKVNINTDKDILALLGASGAGKSVTLKCIAGIDTPDKGQIILDGQTLFDSKKHINIAPQKREVGYLFQQYALFPNMTVEQNINTGLKKIKKSERKKRTAELIKHFHLKGLEKLRPNTLSGGEQQRVALARIFASQPKVLLLDEPFSSLDNFLKWQLELELKNALNEFFGDVIMVSHNIDEVCKLCNNVSVISKGTVQEKKSVYDLIYHPKTLAEAMITGCKNYSSAQHISSGMYHCPDWGINLKTNNDTENAKYIAIKNEDIKFADNESENVLECEVVQIINEKIGRSIALKTTNSIIYMPLKNDSIIPLKHNKFKIYLDSNKLFLLTGSENDD